MEWTDETIKVWFMPRGSAAASALASNSSANASSSPDVSTFGTPVAVFSGCDVPSHFANHQIVFDTTLCGDWAGQDAVWSADATCAAKGATCQAYVAGAPAGDFAEAYWLVNSVKVYQ